MRSGLCIQYKGLAFIVLGAVVLCVTGAEALYADMGHFGAHPIRLTWTFFVLPCLVLNYFGQGALMISDPDAVDNPFFLLAPEWLRLPMVMLATVATVIASQAVISGAYSIARQCMQLGFLPRMTVRHTSNTEEGQIYVPQINAMLAVGVLILVLAFKTSRQSRLRLWHRGDRHVPVHLRAGDGGVPPPVPLVARRGDHRVRLVLPDRSGVLFRQHAEGAGGRLGAAGAGHRADRADDLVEARARPAAGALASRTACRSPPFLARLPQSRTIRVPGMAVFLTGNPDYVPTSLLHNLKHNKVLHERVLFVTVQNVDEPEVAAERRDRGGRTGAGHPSRDPALRLHGKPQHPARAGGPARSRAPVRSDAGELLPRPRGAGAGDGAEDAAGGGSGCSW